MAAVQSAPAERWSFGEATILRSVALTHLLLLVAGLLAPAAIFAPWGLPFEEPATFYRFAIVAIGALGFALLRAARLPPSEGRLLVETVALVKLAFVAVVVADTLAHRLPNRAPVAASIDLVFGAILYRLARRART